MTAASPRLLSKEQAAAYCGQTLRNFDRMRKAGMLPDRVQGVLRWDIRALDLAIDKLSGATAAPSPDKTETFDPLAKWIKDRDERKSRGR